MYMNSDEWFRKSDILPQIEKTKWCSSFSVIDTDSNLKKLYEALASEGFNGIVSGLFQDNADFVTNMLLFPIRLHYSEQVEPRPLIIKNFGFDSFVWAKKVTDVYKSAVIESPLFNFGQYYVNRIHNNFADYEGYSKMELWLPFLGFVDVNLNEVLEKYLQILLNVDYKSGEACYYICVTDTQQPMNDIPTDEALKNYRILSTHSFQLGYNIPLGSTNANDIHRNVLLGGLKIAGALATQQYGLAIGAAVSSSRQVTQRVSYDKKGNYAGKTVQASKRQIDRTAQMKHQTANEIFDASISTLSNLVLGGKSGSVNDNALMDSASNYVKVIRYTPKLKPVNAEYRHIFGVPLGEVRTLNELNGFTIVSDFHIENQGFETATQEEIDLIKDNLQSGIILENYN